MTSETQMPTARGEPTAGPQLARADSQRADGRADMTTAERRLLAAMPLHAVTTLHGEAGLRERFAIEIASFSDDDAEPSERSSSRPGCMLATDASANRTSTTCCASLSGSPPTTASATPT